MKIVFWIVGAVVVIFGLLVLIGYLSSDNKDAGSEAAGPETAPLDQSAVATGADTAAPSGVGTDAAGAVVESVVDGGDVAETAVDAVGSVFDLFT